MQAEKLAKLRIIRSVGVGPVIYRRLMQRYENAQRVVDAWASFAKKEMELCAEEKVLREMEKLEHAGGWILLWGEPDYPVALRELPDAPIALSGLGDKNILHKRQVAVVGNRSASAAGISWSRQLAHDLARSGVVITSGLARGVDTAAHEGSLDASGATVAVVAGGVDHVYPPENAKLRERIIANGCVVAEQAWGMAPTAQMFPRRNRIIAGLSVGVVVSEATKNSGSLITAECALNYGREVWAVPGSPSDLRSGGPNWLLKNGATLIEGAADVMAFLPANPAPYVKPLAKQATLFDAPEVEEFVLEKNEGEAALPEASESQPRQIIFALLGNIPATFDELIRQTGLGESALSGILTELELDGHAVREAAGGWRRG